MITTKRDIYSIHKPMEVDGKLMPLHEYMMREGFIIDIEKPFSFKGKLGVVGMVLNLRHLRYKGLKNLLNLKKIET